MGSYRRRIDYRDEYTSVRNLRRIAPVTADDTANSSTHLLGVLERSNQVGANAFLLVATANGDDEDHVVFIASAPPKPIGVTCFPSFIGHPRCNFAGVIVRRVCFYRAGLA